MIALMIFLVICLVAMKVNSTPLCTPTVCPICQWCGYCKEDADCIGGNKCSKEFFPYYSQCVPDPTKYRTGQCFASWYWSTSGCARGSECCDPGTFCEHFPNGGSQCQVDPPVTGAYCKCPSGF